ncbi:MAG: Rod shape-determining protein MreC [uncultured Sulfurovum sp.]|uniref:Rod shape-determining protein MreC n=1 Tax=uncultured Sulfurovum sp. TaxID=269237 RepID=A0A6S6U9L3_9BACT|nr:MAG: Rod shape-determining protein MreC [uncultured Sulfurovum sp.]
MKTRLVIIVMLLLIVAVLLTRNDERITDTLLGIINPIKQNYKNITDQLEDKSHSILFQKESIERLDRENLILRKRLLEQTHYIQQIKNIYTVLPKLSRLPIRNISIAETISYVKLNSFSQIILTKPSQVKENELYGLIQGQVVAGIARVQNNQLYGYLTSDDKCRFSVFIGKDNAPGIATGVQTNEMQIKFIPKWHKIQVGDKVITSGLDDIFFADIPVGVVTKVEIQSSYKVAHIRTYSDTYHPKTFFLINNAKATIAEGFDSNATRLKPFKVNKIVKKENNISNNSSTIDNNYTQPLISSIPSRVDQTQEEIIEPLEVNESTQTSVPKKVIKPEKKITKKRIKRKPRVTKPKIRKPRVKPKPKTNTLDLF